MDDYDSNEIQTIFNKYFDYPQPENGAPTPVHDMPIFRSRQQDGVVGQLAAHKEELNNVKSELNHMEIVRWRKHTNYVNPSNDIIPHLHRHYKPELATKAWCKFHELLCSYDVLPSDLQTSLNCLHLCEAPGGFISSLNQFLKTRKEYRKLKYNWLATSLNPYYEDNPLDFCITDDRLISRTLKRWCFGTDNTGDLFHPGLTKQLRQRAADMFSDGEVHLVTADGGVNCQEDPSNQEKNISQLIYAQVFTALSLLSKGGSLVLKMFTMFEQNSLSLMFLLAQVFSKLSVVKPATSKCGNSEVYIVARDFLGQDCVPLHQLEASFPFTNLKDADMFSIDQIPDEFVEQHIKCVECFKNWQIHAIRRNLYYYDNQNPSEIRYIRKQATQVYVDRCDLHYLKKKDLLVRNGILRHSALDSNIAQRPLLVGSYSDRKTTDKSVDLEMKAAETKGGNKKQIQQEMQKHKQQSQQQQHHDRVEMIHGRPLSSICSSLYCDTNIIHKNIALLSRISSDFDYIQASCAQRGGDNNNHNDISECNDVRLAQLFTHTEGQVTSVCHLQRGTGMLGDIYEMWWQNLLNSSNQSTRVEYRTLEEVVSSEQADVVLSNLLQFAPDQLHTDELKTRCLLLDTCAKMTRVLKTGGKMMMLYSSSLTRLTSQCLWILSQLFDSFSIEVIESHLLPSALLFVGTGYQPIDKFVELFSKAEFEVEEVELLQLYPVTTLLPAQVDFADYVKHTNEECLRQRARLLAQLLQ